MTKVKNATIVVKGTEITIIRERSFDYISLTDMVKSFGDDSIIYNWLRNRNTIEFLGILEQLNNLDFKPLEFERFKIEAGLNRFSLSPKKWIEATNAIGLVSKSGRYGGGTFAHKDIAFEFGSWLSAEFKLYLIKEFQRLKEEESNHQQLELNMALFGKTAAEWRQANPGKKGNLRDVATLEQLVILSNLESLNSVLIHQQVSQQERLVRLNEIAISQMRSLLRNSLLSN